MQLAFIGSQTIRDGVILVNAAAQTKHIRTTGPLLLGSAGMATFG
jgi:hypothetical protein